MNKTEFRLWRRRLKRERQKSAAEERLWVQRHIGSRTDDRDITNRQYLPAGTATFADSILVNRSLKKGDFKTTTPYQKTCKVNRGAALAYYQWWFMNPTTKVETSGKSFKTLGSISSAWWGSYTDAQAVRVNLMTLTQNALLGKILANAPSWDVLTDLAETKETISLLRQTAMKFIHIASMVKHRDLNGLYKHFKVKTRSGRRKFYRRVYQQETLGGRGVMVGSSMANLWMGYRYGFMPMIYSMQSAFIAFGAEFSKGCKLTEQVTIGDQVFQKTESLSQTSYGLKTVDKTTRACSGSFRKKAYFNYTDSMLNRLGVSNPASLVRTAWEVVPFSFVVDWFIGIGNYLDNLQVDTLVCNQSVNVTEKATTRRSSWFELNGAASNYRHTIARYETWLSTYFYFNRSKGSLSVPGIDLSQSWYTAKRGIDSACLSWQRFKGHLNSYVDPKTGLHYRVH